MTNPQPISYSKAKTKSVSLKIRNKTEMSAFTSLTQHNTGSSSQAIRQEEKIKGIQIEKEA